MADSGPVSGFLAFVAFAFLCGAALITCMYSISTISTFAMTVSSDFVLRLALSPHRLLTCADNCSDHAHRLALHADFVWPPAPIDEQSGLFVLV